MTNANKLTNIALLYTPATDFLENSDFVVIVVFNYYFHISFFGVQYQKKKSYK